MGLIGRTSFTYDVTVSPVNGTAIIYVPIAIDEDGSISEVMDNLTIYSYPGDNVPGSNASCEIIDTIHGKALEIVTDEPIRIKNKITQRGSNAELNITLWNETLENSTGSIWIYMDGSSTAEDVSITFKARYIQVFMAYGNGVKITTEPYLNDVTVLKTGWNTYPVYQRRWG